MRATVADAERRLARLRSEIEGGAVSRSPALDQATEDLGVSLEELNVALEELETTNEELAAAKIAAEREGRRYEELFRLAPAASLVTDRSGVIQEANQAAENLFGRRAEYLIGKPLSVFVDSADQQHFVSFLDRIRASEGETLEDKELWIRTSPDRRFTVGVTAGPVLDRYGKVEGARWLVRDLSSQLRDERERREAGERQAYGHIAGGVINHVNNLLGSIRGYSEIIARLPETGPRGQRAASQIHTATERGERMTSELLTFARAGRGPALVPSVNQFVLAACQEVGEMRPEGAKIITDFDAEVPPVKVDTLDLYQSVVNLLLNARDALENEGQIHVETRIVELDSSEAEAIDLEAGQYVAIVVRDEGRGMDAPTRARAREPFFSTKAIGKGFGLGLSTVEAVVQEAGGALDLASEAGEGSVVTLYLPRA